MRTLSGFIGTALIGDRGSRMPKTQLVGLMIVLDARFCHGVETLLEPLIPGRRSGIRGSLYFTLTRTASFLGRPCLARVRARVFNAVSSVR